MRSSSAGAVAFLLLGLFGTGAVAQESGGGTDWGAKVKAAIASPRYAVQRAASNEVARGGDAAVPAITAYIEAHGKDAVPMLLVDAIAQAKGGGEATAGLLRQWAIDLEFNWRAQALTGLALRASAADAELFAAALQDPSHLFRVAGAKGVHALATAGDGDWDAAKAVLADPDPRARVMFALYLWERRELSARVVLVQAVADDRAFLDDDWGRRHAVQALRALASAAQTDFGYKATQSLAGNRDAIAKMAAWAEIETPTLRERDAIADRGGIEFRSCRHGDLFVRWTEDEVFLDLDRGRRLPLTADVRKELDAAIEAAHTALTEPRQVFGSVVCDYVQITLRHPARLWKVAPGSLPPKLLALLATFDIADFATRLPQFAK